MRASRPARRMQLWVAALPAVLATRKRFVWRIGTVVCVRPHGGPVRVWRSESPDAPPRSWFTALLKPLMLLMCEEISAGPCGRLGRAPRRLALHRGTASVAVNEEKALHCAPFINIRPSPAVSSEEYCFLKMNNRDTTFGLWGAESGFALVFPKWLWLVWHNRTAAVKATEQT